MEKPKENVIEKMLQQNTVGEAFIQVGEDGDPVLTVRLNTVGKKLLKKLKEMGHKPEFKFYYKRNGKI